MANLAVLATLVLCSVCSCSRITIEKNGYKNVLVALPSNIPANERSRLIKSVEDVFQESSHLLQSSTKGRAYFSEITVLLPKDWTLSPNDPILKKTSYNASLVVEAGATESLSDADLIVTGKGQFSFVLHHEGCGRQALRIQMPKDYILRKGLIEKSVELTRLWSEYRYGLFPEGGFQNDNRFPDSYKMPGGTEEKKTKCRDNKYWIPLTCPDNERCEVSSLMDQHAPTTATRFCEGEMSLGPRHDSESPSKHNLLCKEEGTWFTVMRSPDFARGKNSAPRNLTDASVTFKYIREPIFPHFVVAIDASSRMKQEIGFCSLKSRYAVAKSAFSRFVYSVLPDRSQLTLFSFGSSRGPVLVRPPFMISDEDSRVNYLESLPLSEEAEDYDDVCLDCAIQAIMQNMVDAENNLLSFNLIVITADTNSTRFGEYRDLFHKSAIKMSVLLFQDTITYDTNLLELSSLCAETGGDLVYVGNDAFGDLYKGMGKAVKSSKSEVLMHQEYLPDGDNSDIEASFTVDSSLTHSIRVSLSGPSFCTPPLKFEKTSLRTPGGLVLSFKRKELLPAWIVDVPNAEIGEYILITRRKENLPSPVLLYVTGTPGSGTDSISVHLWTEKLHNYRASPAPIRIFAEVKAGWDPVKGAKVTAYVYHPDKAVTELMLLDDGLGDTDITVADGIYSRYFTNFTSSGFYNVYVKVHDDQNRADILHGPTDACCGSSFTFSESRSTGRFTRENGPSTFYISAVNTDADIYPPSRITDLRIAHVYDQVHVLQWTAVGGDFDSGFAEKYELKLFPDRSVARNRFSDPGLDIFREEFENTQRAEYGATLNHAMKIPQTAREGLYYFSIRAIDGAGNAGEPSNTVPVMVTETAEPPSCSDDQPVAELLVDDTGSSSSRSPSILLISLIIATAVLLK